MMIFESLIDILFPRTCVICGKRIGKNEHGVCIPCLSNLPYRSPGDFTCNDMTARLIGNTHIKRCAALCNYNPTSPIHNLIYAFKYDGRKDIAEMMGELMGTTFKNKGFFDGIDIIVPLPLHKKRERKRGYNQSYHLALGISKVTGLPIANAVSRTVNNKSQTTMNQSQRHKNVENIFSLAEEESCRGKHVLLVDDILTTGSTIMSCAKVLSGNASAISILTLTATNG